MAGQGVGGRHAGQVCRNGRRVQSDRTASCQQQSHKAASEHTAASAYISVLLKAQHTLSCPAAVLLAVLTADLLGWDFFKIWLVGRRGVHGLKPACQSAAKLLSCTCRDPSAASVMAWVQPQSVCSLAYVGPVEHKAPLFVRLSKQQWIAAAGLHEVLGSSWRSTVPVPVQHVLLVLTPAGQASMLN